MSNERPDIIIPAKSLQGENFELSNGLVMKHPKVQDILDFGEDRYAQVISMFTTHPFDMQAELYHLSEGEITNYSDVSQFEIFTILYQQYNARQENENEIWELLLDGDFNLELSSLETANGNTVILIDYKNKIAIQEKNFIEMSEFIRQINKIPFNTRAYAKRSDMAIRESLRASLSRYEYNKNAKIDPDSVQFISNIMNKLVIATSITRSELYNEYIYNFYSILEETAKYLSWQHTMTGVMMGNIDYSKLNKDDRSWL